MPQFSSFLVCNTIFVRETIYYLALVHLVMSFHRVLFLKVIFARIISPNHSPVFPTVTT
jgi:hypothetical protein